MIHEKTGIQRSRHTVFLISLSFPLRHLIMFLDKLSMSCTGKIQSWYSSMNTSTSAPGIVRGGGEGDISPAGQLWLSYSVHFFSLALQRLLQPAFTECLRFSFQSGTFPSNYTIKMIMLMLIEIVSACTHLCAFF
jgi:hypothetical protein